MLNKKNGLDTRNSTLRQYPVGWYYLILIKTELKFHIKHLIIITGGTYIKLENEWKEAQAQWSNVKPRKNKDKLKH